MQCCLLLLHINILDEFESKSLLKIQHTSTFLACKVGFCQETIHFCGGEEESEDPIGHLLVAHTTSRLIGECRFPLWSSTACQNMKWLWMTSGYLKVVNFLVPPSLQSHCVSLPMSQSFVPYVDMRDMT